MMRMLLKVLGILVALIGVALAVVLVPPHLQISKIEPSIPNISELKKLTEGVDGPKGVRYLITSSQQLPGAVLSHSSFILDWANGTSFIIDVGMDQKEAIEFSKIMEYTGGAEPAIYHGNVAEILDEDIQAIKGMAFTHLHADHTQGISVFCENVSGPVEAYQTGWQQKYHNFHTEDGAKLLANSCLTPVSLSGDKIHQLDKFPGLLAVGLGGHTPGSTLFAFSIDGMLYLLSGDITNSKNEILTNQGKGFVYSTFLVPENTRRTEALRIWLAEVEAMIDVKVIVSHDLADIEASGIPKYSK
ncbi:MAG: glyoxylase-like metal-dependent hydrolase (beta-lactamase superfamily II) [Flavobacterium sp.]|jgi:glyoxylase-like metal-dependent hydrolase (beta-lactamase superfamily II)